MANTLPEEKKCKLYDWVRRNKDLTEKPVKLAEMASFDLQFHITESNVEYAWTKINGPRSKHKCDLSNEMFLKRINDLQTQLDIANDKISRLTKRIEAQEGRML